MTDITITPAGRFAAVRFPYDEALLARFRAAFPTAKWNAPIRAWMVGPIAQKGLAGFQASERARTAANPEPTDQDDAALKALQDIIGTKP